MDQVQGAVASGRLKAGDQLPTIRKVAVDLAINPNTVSRAYRELEQCGTAETQHGTGCFVAEPNRLPEAHTEVRLRQFAGEVAAKAGTLGLTIGQVVTELKRLDVREKGKGHTNAIED